MQLAKMSIDPKFIELTADAFLEDFFKIINNLAVRTYARTLTYKTSFFLLFLRF